MCECLEINHYEDIMEQRMKTTQRMNKSEFEYVTDEELNISAKRKIFYVTAEVLSVICKSIKWTKLRWKL